MNLRDKLFRNSSATKTEIPAKEAAKRASPAVASISIRPNTFVTFTDSFEILVDTVAAAVDIVAKTAVNANSFACSAATESASFERANANVELRCGVNK